MLLWTPMTFTKPGAPASFDSVGLVWAPNLQLLALTRETSFFFVCSTDVTTHTPVQPTAPTATRI
eukprot:m.40343 g.40343  ORF g.40343 m.40343 type:complete len:65 (-) comp8065_c0_seq2:110-304(-)